MVNKKISHWKKEEEQNLQEQKYFAKVAVVVIVAFIGICLAIGLSDKLSPKKKSNPQTSQILQPVELASQLT